LCCSYLNSMQVIYKSQKHFDIYYREFAQDLSSVQFEGGSGVSFKVWQ